MAVNDFEPDIEAAAAKYGVDPRIIRTTMKIESDGNPRARSSAGAEGLMQLMPATARAMGVKDPFDPGQNIDGATAVLAEDLSRYGNDPLKTALAFHSGPKAVDTRRVGPAGAQYQTKFLNEFKAEGGTLPPGSAPLPQTLPGHSHHRNSPNNSVFGATGVEQDDFSRIMAAVDADPNIKRAEALDSAQEAANEVLKVQTKAYHEEMARLMGKEDAEYATMPKMEKLGRVPKETLEPIRNPLTALQQFLPLLALLGGVANKKFALAAMDASTAAMTAQKAGDYAKRDEAHQLYLDNAKATVENNAVVVNEYREALEAKKASLDQIKSRFQTIAALHQDDVMQSTLPTGSLERLSKVVDMRYKATEGMAKLLATQYAAGKGLKPYKTDNGTMVNFYAGQWYVAAGPRMNQPWDKALDGEIQLNSQGRGLGMMELSEFEAEYAKNHNGEKPPRSLSDQWVASRKAATSELTQVEKQLGSLEPYVGTADFEAQRVLSRLGEINPTQYRQWNTWVRGGRRDLMGDPAIVKFDEALYSLKQEYAKIMSGAVGSVAQTMQHNADAVDQVISGNMSYDQITAVVPSMMQSIHQRLDLLQQQREKVQSGVSETTARLAGSSTPAAAPPPAAPPASGGWRPLTDHEVSELKRAKRVKYNADGHMIVVWGDKWVDGETGKPL